MKDIEDKYYENKLRKRVDELCALTDLRKELAEIKPVQKTATQYALEQMARNTIAQNRNFKRAICSKRMTKNRSYRQWVLEA